MTPIEAGEEILRCIDYIPTQYPDNQDRICELQAQTTDLLHMIEFTPCDIQKGYKFTKNLQDICIERRCLKDENEALRPLFDCLSAPNAVAFKNGFIGALTKAKQRKRDLASRIYGPRSERFQDAVISKE